LNSTAINLHNDVAVPEARRICRRTLHNLGYNDPLRDVQVKTLRQLCIDGLHLDTDIRSTYLTICLQLVSHPADKVHRNGKADAIITAAASRNRCVDTDNFTAQVDQWTAAAARVYGCVCLAFASEVAGCPSLPKENCPFFPSSRKSGGNSIIRHSFFPTMPSGS
jgi:hypothetical protein